MVACPVNAVNFKIFTQYGSIIYTSHVSRLRYFCIVANIHRAREVLRMITSEFPNANLPAGCELLGEYSEGNFSALVWVHSRSYVHGWTIIGDAEDEPAFSDQSNSLTQLLRSLKHLERLAPQRLVVDWRLRSVESTPEALILASLRKLSKRRCVLAMVINKDSDHAIASKLLGLCQLGKSVPQAIESLRLSQIPKSGRSRETFPGWAPVVAGIIGVMTFLFFVALSATSLVYRPLPPAGRFPAEVVLALGGAVSSGLFGGYTAVNGPLPIPFAHNSTPVQISVVGGAAILIILLVLGKILFG
jgi:hypothetical protein